MKSLKLLAFPFLLLCVFVIQSCEKDESMVDAEDLALIKDLDCFFSNDCIDYLKSKSSQEEEKKEIKRIKKWFKENQEKKKRFKKRVGTPIWKKYVDLSLEDQRQYLIPVVKEGSTNAFLIAYVNPDDSKITYRTVKKSKIDKYRRFEDIEEPTKQLSLEQVVVGFLNFDSILFGTTDCSLIKLLPSKNKSKGCSWEPVTEVTNIWIQTNGYWEVTTSYEYGYVCTDEAPSIYDEPGRGGGGVNPEHEECEPGFVRDANGACVDEEEGLCPDALYATRIQDAYYVQMSGLSLLTYRHDETGLTYNLGLNTLCIQVKTTSLLGFPIDRFQAAEGIATAFDIARSDSEAFLDFLDAHDMNPSETDLREFFKIMLRAELILEFGGNPTLNSMGCSGAGSTIPNSDVSGLTNWQCN